MQEQQLPAYTPPVLVLTNPEERIACCAWCWPKRHPESPYPRELSSTICPECEAEMEAQRARRRATRARDLLTMDLTQRAVVHVAPSVQAYAERPETTQASQHK